MQPMNPLFIRGVLYGVPAFVSLALMLRAALGARRPETEKFCARGAALCFFSAFLLCLLGLVDPVVPFNAPAMTAWSILFWFTSTLGGFMGMIGLVNLGRPEYGAKGKGWGWTAVLLWFVVQTAVFAVMIDNIRVYLAKAQVPSPLVSAEETAAPQAEAGPVDYPEHNFRFTPPGTPWIDFNVKAANPNAVTGYFKGSPEVFFMIGTEEGADVGNGYSETMIDIMIKMQAQGFQGEPAIPERGDWTLNGYKGYRFVREGKINGVAIRQVYWIYHRGGVYYHIVAWSGIDESPEMLKQAFDELAAGFEIIDLNYRAVPEGASESLGVFRSEDYGYEVDLGSGSWQPWDGKASLLPAAEYAVVSDKAMVFLAVPLPLYGFDPPLHHLAQSFLSTMGIDFKQIAHGRLEKIEKDGYTGYAFNFDRTVEDGARASYRFKILKGRELAFMAAASRIEGVTSATNEELAQAVEKFTPPAASRKAPSAPAPEQKALHAHYFNQLGLSLYSSGQKSQSLDYFKQAVLLDPSEDEFLANVLHVYGELGQFDEAYQYIEDKMERMRRSKDMLLLLGQINEEAGRSEEAVEIFEELLEQGYRDYDLIDSYVSALWTLGRKDEAFDVIDKQLEENDSLELRLLQAVMHERNGQMEEAGEELQKLYESYPFNQLVQSHLFSLLSAQEEYDRMLAILEKHIDEIGGGAEIYYNKGAAELSLERMRDAQASFQKVLEIDPGHASARAYLEQLNKILGQADTREVRRFLEPAPIPAGLMNRAPVAAFDREMQKNHGAYYEQDISAVYFKKNEPKRLTNYFRVKVLDSAGLEQFSEFRFPYDSLNESVFVNKLVTYAEDGRVTGEASPDDFYIVDDSDAGYASHNKVLHVPVPGLERGGTVEVMVTYQDRKAEEFMTLEEFFFSTETPLLQTHVYLSGDIDLVKVVKTDDVKETRLEGAVQWTLDDVPVFESEDNLPFGEYFSPYLKLGSTEAAWKKLGLDYLNELKDVLPPEKEIQELAAGLTEGKRTADEKIESILAYIQEGFTYTAIEFGQRAMIPQKASAVARQKYGDCKDHSILLYQLLRASGFDARLALASFDTRVDPSLASLDQFDHMIVYTRDYSKGPFIDATPKNLPFGYLPADLLNNYAFVLDEKEPFLELIKRLPENTARVRAERELTVEERDLLINETVTFEGYAAANLRENLLAIERSALLKSFQETFAKRYRQIEIEDLDVGALDRMQEPLVINLRYRIRNLFHYVDDRLVGQLPALWENFYLQMNFTRNRRYEFEFGYPIRLESRVAFRKPEALRFDDRTKDKKIDLNEDPIFLKGEWRQKDGSYALEAEARIGEGIFPEDRYARTQADSEKALNFLQPEIILSHSTNA